MNRDLTAVVAAILVHGALAYGLSRAPHLFHRGIHTVEVDVRRPPPPPLPKVVPPPPPKEPEPPPPPPPKIKPKRIEAPIPNEKPKEPPKEPAKPIFGLTAASTTSDSSFTAPVGNTTIADPNAPRPKGPVMPLGAAPQAAAPGPAAFRPAPDSEIEKYPDFEDGSCDAVYPDGEAKEAGIQGETILKVEIDEQGKVHGVRVMKGVGHGLDELAVALVKKKCRYSPAYNKAGKPVPSVIPHRVNWRID